MIGEVFKNLVSTLSKLPFVSRKNAEHLAYFLLSNRSESSKMLDALSKASKIVKNCQLCNNFCLDKRCKICEDDKRDNSICVVQTVKDLVKIEKSRSYFGKYHILGGKLDPLSSIDEPLDTSKLLKRAKGSKEIILALDPDSEGEATSLYLRELLSDIDIKVTKLAQGLSPGSKVDLTDSSTLSNAILNRKDY